MTGQIVRVQKKQPKEGKDYYIDRLMAICGGKVSYWQPYKKDELKALLKAVESDTNIKSAIKLTMKIREEQAQTNRRVNGERLGQSSRAKSLERKYKEEMEKRYDAESKVELLMEKIKKLLSVEESELIRASKIVMNLITQFFPNKDDSINAKKN